MPDVYVPTEDGRFVSEKHARVAEIIADRYPNLSLAWVPPERRDDPTDPPFAVVASPDGHAPYVVMYAMEDEVDERLLARIYDADNTKGDVQARMEAHNRAVKDMQRKEYEDAMAEQMAIAQSIINSPKSAYKHDGKVYR